MRALQAYVTITILQSNGQNSNMTIQRYFGYFALVSFVLGTIALIAMQGSQSSIDFQPSSLSAGWIPGFLLLFSLPPSFFGLFLAFLRFPRGLKWLLATVTLFGVLSAFAAWFVLASTEIDCTSACRRIVPGVLTNTEMLLFATGLLIVWSVIPLILFFRAKVQK